MIAIHKAVLKSGGVDDCNADSKTVPNYKKQFWKLPTVDHSGEDLTANAPTISHSEIFDRKQFSSVKTSVS